jgi:hypothetical protein
VAYNTKPRMQDKTPPRQLSKELPPFPIDTQTLHCHQNLNKQKIEKKLV